MSTEDRTVIAGYDGDTGYANDDTCGASQRPGNAVQKPSAEPHNSAPSGSGGTAAGVVIGAVGGLAMGAAGAYAGTRIFADDDAPKGVVEPSIDDVEESGNAAGGVGEILSAKAEDAEAIQIASSVNDDMSFSEAFAAARAEVGAGGVFEWKGNLYNTYYKEEWDAMSAEEKNEFSQSLQETDVQAGQEIVADEGEPVVAIVDDSDDEVRILGVIEENVEGQDMYIGAVEVEGENILYIDADHDGLFDVAVSDLDHNGSIDEFEILDVSEAGFSVDDMAAQMMDIDNDLLSSNDLPDYMNDADVSMC